MCGLVLLTAACSEPEQVSAPDRQPDAASLRSTIQGDVIGFVDGYDTYGWMGIPYAAPPINDLRWKAPRPPAMRNESLNAIKPGNACAQPAGAALEAEVEHSILGSEDCLYMNIWAPRKTPAEGLPVMVWLHGGGNTIGTANTYTTMSELAGPQQVVVVALNYRLGLFGWFSHPALKSGETLDDSGNYATLDMIQGLKWVEENITAFGGDPNRVTIFGESAGGGNVLSLLVSDLAKGLFDGAIVQSGLNRIWSIEEATNGVEPTRDAADAASLIDHVLLNTGRAEDLASARVMQQNMSSEDLREFLYDLDNSVLITPVLPKDTGGFPMYSWPSIIADGTVLPQHTILDALANMGEDAEVPVILGTNRDEFKLFQFLDQNYMRKWFGMIPSARDREQYLRDARYSSDLWRALGAIEPANRLSDRESQNIYTYRFDWDELPAGWPVNLAQLVGAAHGMEIGFVLGGSTDMVKMFRGDIKSNAVGRKQLSNAMKEYWAEFAYTGNPGRGRSGNLPEWQSWQRNQETLILDTEADGGIRMANTNKTIDSVKQALQIDDSFDHPRERCELYSLLFYKRFPGSELWQQDEYEKFTESCKDVPLTGVF